MARHAPLGRQARPWRPREHKSASIKRESGRLRPAWEAIEAQLPKARKRLDQFPQGCLWLEQMGRCLRRLGDPEAEAYFRQAVANYPFLMGRDDEVGELIALLQAIEPHRNLFVYAIAKLAAEAMAELAGMIQRSRAKVWDAGGILLWGWSEIALEAWRSLAKSDSG